MPKGQSLSRLDKNRKELPGLLKRNIVASGADKPSPLWRDHRTLQLKNEAAFVIISQASHAYPLSCKKMLALSFVNMNIPA
jgi:hypothetical protein